MIERINGIVLRTVKYGDSSVVVDVFTREYGRRSFMASLSRSRLGGGKDRAFWQPLSMVEFCADIRPSGKMPKPQDIASAYSYVDMPYNPFKSTVAIFLAEFLCGALRNEDGGTPLYEYIVASLKWLDCMDDVNGIANFHLVFLMKISRFLGIMPNGDIERQRVGMFFDLLNGTFCGIQPSHSYYLRPDEANLIPLLLKMDYSNAHKFRFTRLQRHRILEILNTYYRLHVPQFPELKSVSVLREVFD